MGPFISPFNNLLCMLLGISFTVWVTLLLVFIIVPAIFGLSFGIRGLYMKMLLKVFKVSWKIILFHFKMVKKIVLQTDLFVGFFVY